MESKGEILKIFEAIKKDDLLSFSSLVNENNQNLSFGRFPLLSLIYLYNAKQIKKAYEVTLKKVKEFEKMEEPVEIYKKFRIFAEKTLRLYSNQDIFISPIEILAIMGNDAKVKKMYAQLDINEDVQANLISIYSIKGQSCEVFSNEIKIGQKRWSYFEKSRLGICCLILSVFVIFVCGGYFLLDGCVGTGIFSQSKISSQNQLYSALKGENSYVLKNDFVVNKTGNHNFSGVIDGANHTLEISDLSNGSLMKTNNGVIKNLTVVCHISANAKIDNSLFAICEENNGTIENVKIVIECESEITLAKRDDVVSVSGVSKVNNGEILRCYVEIELNVVSDNTGGDGDAYVSGIAYENNGKISDCSVSSENGVFASDCDVSGIVSTNGENGIILNCVNNAKLTQTNALDKWNPNVAGIAINNYGDVEDCENFGDLIVSSTVDSESSSCVFVGGIVSMNYSNITHSKNNADIEISSKQKMIYSGGICAFSNGFTLSSGEESRTSSIVECGQVGNFSFDVADNIYVVAGGLVGRNDYYEIRNCFASSQFLNLSFTGSQSNNYHYAGLFIGFCFNQMIYYAQENIVTSADEWTQVAGILTVNYFGNQLYIEQSHVNFSNAEYVETVETFDELKEKDVYYE